MCRARNVNLSLLTFTRHIEERPGHVAGIIRGAGNKHRRDRIHKHMRTGNRGLSIVGLVQRPAEEIERVEGFEQLRQIKPSIVGDGVSRDIRIPGSVKPLLMTRPLPISRDIAELRRRVGGVPPDRATIAPADDPVRQHRRFADTWGAGKDGHGPEREDTWDGVWEGRCSRWGGRRVRTQAVALPTRGRLPQAPTWSCVVWKRPNAKRRKGAGTGMAGGW